MAGRGSRWAGRVPWPDYGVDTVFYSPIKCASLRSQLLLGNPEHLLSEPELANPSGPSLPPPDSPQLACLCRCPPRIFGPREPLSRKLPWSGPNSLAPLLQGPSRTLHRESFIHHSVQESNMPCDSVSSSQAPDTVTPHPLLCFLSVPVTHQEQTPPHPGPRGELMGVPSSHRRWLYKPFASTLPGFREEALL